jgi:hypothetical protein
MMKKLILFLLLLTVPFIGQAAAKKSVGHFEDVKGEISTRVGLKKAAPAKNGMKVYEGMRIKVKEKGSLKIIFNDKSNVQLGPNTLFRVKNKSQDSSKTNLTLFEGLARVNAHKLKKKDNFAIKTPSAVAGVRGTFFDARVSRSAAINVRCYSTAGIGVVVRTPTGARTVGAGYSAVATSTGTIKMKKMARGVVVKTKTGGQKKKAKKAAPKKGAVVKTKTVNAKKTKDGAKSESSSDSGSASKTSAATEEKTDDSSTEEGATTEESTTTEEETAEPETVEPPPISEEPDLGDDFGSDDFEVDTSVEVIDNAADVGEIANEINDNITAEVQAEADKEIVKEAVLDLEREIQIKFTIEDK